MILSYEVNFDKMTALELCEYLEQKYYTELLAHFKVFQKYFEISNLYENDIEEKNIAQFLINKLNQQTNLVVKNDSIILFPKIKLSNFKINKVSLENLNKIHSSIISLLQKIKFFFNNYKQQPFWNIQSQLSCYEMQSIDEVFRNIIYIKEKFLWAKIKINSLEN